MAQSAGYVGKLQYGAADSGYVTIVGVTNVSDSDGIDELDITDLGDATVVGYREFIMGLRGLTISFDIDEFDGNTEQDAIRAAFIARTKFYLKYMPDGSNGLSCGGYVTSYNRSTAVDGKATASVTFRASGIITAI